MSDDNEMDGMNVDALAMLNVETDIQTVSVASVALLNKSEIEAQLAAAHAYPRSIARFLTEARGLATITRDVAASCIYSVERGRNRDGSVKFITGPSVRLSEIVASAYRNLHLGSRVIDAEETVVVSQGVAWDLEKNVRITVEARRRILDKKGKRYNEDMITMTGNAAASIARRNAVFVVIPRAYVQLVYGDARKVSVGDAKTLGERREGTFAHFEKLGVSPDRVLAKVGKRAIEDVDLETLETLIGLGTSIRNNDRSIDEVFPVESKAASGLEAKIHAMPQEPPAKASSASSPIVTPAPSTSLEDQLAASVKRAAPESKPKAPKAEPKTAEYDPCMVCKKPIVGHAVETTDDDGVVGMRHPGCLPFVPREPGED